VRWFLIDQLLECEPGKRAVAVKTFPLSDLVFLTHFDRDPVVPGVLQIEMVAQAAAKSLKIFRPDMVTMLVSVKSAKFLRQVTAGDRCHIVVDITTRDHYAHERGVVDVDGVRVSEMELLVAFKPRVAAERPEDDVVIAAWQRRTGGHREPPAMGARVDAVVA